MKSIKVRMPEQMHEQIREAASNAGFQSLNAWMVNAFVNGLRYETSKAVHDFEARLVDEFERIHSEQAQIAALVDTLVRFSLLSTPTPQMTPDAVAEANQRHQHFIKRAAKTLNSGVFKMLAESANGNGQG